MENGRKFVKPEDRYVTSARAKRRAPGSDLGAWIQGLADEKGLTLKGLSLEIGQGERYLSRFRAQKRPTLETLVQVLEVLGSIGFLTEGQKAALADAIESTITGLLDKYGSLTEVSPLRIKAIQDKQPSGCRSYTGAEAAREIGVTRSAVQKWRIKLKLPLLLSPEHVQEILEHVKKSK